MLSRYPKSTAKNDSRLAAAQEASIEITPEAVESAITGQIRRQATQSASATGEFWGRIAMEGHVIECRAFTLPGGTINIGTYYRVMP